MNAKGVLCLGSLALLLAGPLSAAVFNDDFQTLYTPGVATNAGDTHLNSAAWNAIGNEIWSNTFSSTSGNRYIKIEGGTSSWNSVGFTTKANDLGFNTSSGQRYTADVVNYYNNSNYALFTFGVLGDGSNLWTSTQAVVLRFSSNWIMLNDKDNGAQGW
jgi:hypothetical protein